MDGNDMVTRVIIDEVVGAGAFVLSFYHGKVHLGTERVTTWQEAQEAMAERGFLAEVEYGFTAAE